MTRTCRGCGVALPAGAGRCPSCLAVVKTPGFFQRLRDAFRGAVQIQIARGESAAPERGVHVKFQTSVQRTYKVLDPKTGQFSEYQSLDEVPPEIRALIERVQQDGGR